MILNTIQQDFLDNYLALQTQKEKSDIPEPIAEFFCADEYNTNECARLINAGIKRASCSMKSAYDIENEPYPVVGRLTVVLDWEENPVCIIKLTDVSICAFNEVSRDFAESEGEGDGTYEWWKSAHIKFFTEYAEQIGEVFTEQSDLILERFEKVFPL